MQKPLRSSQSFNEQQTKVVASLTIGEGDSNTVWRLCFGIAVLMLVMEIKRR